MTRLRFAASAFVIVALVTICARLVAQQEKIKLASPVLADPGASSFAPATVCFDARGAEILVMMWEHDGTGFVGDRHFVFRYTGEEAKTLMAQINTMNFAPPNPSLRKRLMQKAQTDGKLAAGTIQEKP